MYFYPWLYVQGDTLHSFADIAQLKISRTALGDAIQPVDIQK